MPKESESGGCGLFLSIVALVVMLFMLADQVKKLGERIERLEQLIETLKKK